MTHIAYPAGFVPPHRLTGLSPSTPILIGFSGGADSTALLLALAAYAALHHTPLYALHLHHGIRGTDADRDADFCRQTAQAAKIPFTLIHADVPAYAKEHGLSLETAGRELRHDCFAALMREKEIPILTLAHHADDHMETVLYRLLRGTGAKGLCGIPPVRPFSESGVLIRPLLHCRKEDLLTYLEIRGQAYCTDITNAEDDCDRNRIRHHLVPVLRTLSEHPEERFLRLSDTMREDCAALDLLAAQAYRAAGTGNGALSATALREYPAAIRKRVYIIWLSDMGLPAPEAIHLHALDQAVAARNRTARIALPGRAFALFDGSAPDLLILQRNDPMPDNGRKSTV